MKIDYNSYYINQAKKNSNQLGFGIPVAKNNSVLDNLNKIFNKSDHQEIVSSINTTNPRKRRAVRSMSTNRGGQRKKSKRSIKRSGLKKKSKKNIKKSVKRQISISRDKKVKKSSAKKNIKSKSRPTDIFH